MADWIEELKRLSSLHEQGILSDDEFEELKRGLLPNAPDEPEGEVVKEDIGSFKDYMANVEASKKRQQDKQENRKKKSDAYIERVRKGIKFYDAKGSGRMVKGKKVYDRK